MINRSLLLGKIDIYKECLHRILRIIAVFFLNFLFLQLQVLSIVSVFSYIGTAVSTMIPILISTLIYVSDLISYHLLYNGRAYLSTRVINCIAS